MSATPSAIRPSIGRSVIRLIKVGVSFLYWLCRLATERVRRLYNPHQPGTCVVLYYHSVAESYRDRFEVQMRMLAGQVTPIALSGIDNLATQTHSVAITFDDGLASFVENAVPVLLKMNIPATVFVVADTLGTKPEWSASYYDPAERVMSAEQLKGLPDLISVGSHTLTHPDLAKLRPEAAAREIVESRKKLELLLNRPVTIFSFPHGEFSNSVVSECREAGYQRVFSIEPKMISSVQLEFVVGRVGVDPWDWPLEFKLKMLGAYRWQPYFRSARRRMKRIFSRTRGSKPTNVALARPASHS